MEVTMVSDLPVQPYVILLLASLIDALLGEPPVKLHPTVWMGRMISFLKPRAGSRSRLVGRMEGVLLVISVVGVFSMATYVTLLATKGFAGELALVILAAVLLKPTFAVRCMHQYARQVAGALDGGHMDGARELLPFLVRRDPANLGTGLIVSATVESIAEGTADGVTSSLFYYSFFGVPGAMAFRAINTLDSMVGYRDPKHVDIGWFSARIDTTANFIPVRLTSILMVISAMLLREDWRAAWRIMLRDRGKTRSINAGWPIGAMAGALGIRLEKTGHYALGDPVDSPTPGHIARALRVMTMTTILFGLLVVVPIIYLVTVIV
jgi:adenosylcobinamide-phosphate synthase